MKLDLSNKNLQRIELAYLNKFLTNEHNDEQHTEIILLDNNSLSKLENLDKFTQLKHLSLTNNRLVEIKLISKLNNLQFVNLLNNSLTNLNAFKDLKFLTWLNVSGNQIKSLEPLKSNTNLEYLDASDNSIATLSDLSSLTHLETLNLNGNEINSLEMLQNYNRNLKHLHLSFNAIEDLNEVCYLVQFEKIESLSITNNPCVAYSSGSNYIEHMLNYRPFIINWCLSLHSLDGSEISQKEYLKAEWLYSQGKGRHFRLGQHSLLIDYLLKVCPYSAAESIEEEVRLSKILEKKEAYQTEIVRKDVPFLSNQLPYQGSHHLIRTTNNKIQYNTKQPETALSPNPNSYFSTSENNLIDDINLSSSGSTFGGDLDDQFDFEANLKVFKLYGEKTTNNKLDAEMINDLDNANKTRYDEYDRRPIKPLDKNLFEKQLSEYTEISNEELEELKHKTVQHIRSKTVETGLKLPMQKNFARTPPTRKLAFNNSNSNQSNNLTKKEPNTKMRRRTVDVEIKTTKLASPANQTRTKSKLNTQSNSPKPTTSNYLSHLNHSSTKSTTSTSSTKSSLNKKTFTPKSDFKKFSESEDDSTAKSSNDNLNEETSKSSNLKKLCQLKQQEIQNRIQKQRQEMLLNKQKNLNEFRLKLKQEEDAKRLEAENKNKLQKTITFEDQCAIKIQSAWRGYYVRKMFKRQKPNDNKYKDIISYLDMFRKNLSEISNEHRNLKNMHSESIEKIWKAISGFKESLQSASANESSTSSTDSTSLEGLIKSKIDPLSSSESDIKRENRMLKQKIFLLEERCASLEEKLNLVLKQQIKEAESRKSDVSVDKKSVSESSEIKSQPKIEIYPPLRVRLQKLNEKRVALKWSPNPKNALIELTGYNIYINGKLCGKMGPNDSIASINGINQEGEYKIFIRSYYANVESENSNEVVTRVKRKQPSKTNASTVESDENNLTNNSNNRTSNTNELNESFDKTKSDSNEPIKYKLQSNSGAQSTNSEISSSIKRNPVSERKELWDSNSSNFVNNDKPKHLDSHRDDLDVSNSSETSTTSTTSKTTTTNTVFKPIKSSLSPNSNMIDAKYSTSEPNLSNSSNPNMSSNKNRSSFVRQSISFNNDDLDDTNNLGDSNMKFDYDSKKENLNDTEESKIESTSKLITSRNGKIFNQVQNVKSSH